MDKKSETLEQLEAALLKLEDLLVCEADLAALDAEVLLGLQQRLAALTAYPVKALLAAQLQQPRLEIPEQPDDAEPLRQDLAKLVILPESESQPEPEPMAEIKPSIPSFDLKKRVAALDYFRYMRELFDNDETLMYRANEIATEASSCDEAMQQLLDQLCWNAEGDAEQLFAEQLKQYYRERSRLA